MTKNQPAPGDGAGPRGRRSGDRPVRMGVAGPVQGGGPGRRWRPGADTGGRASRRLVGVDAARGVALFGMVAVHTFPLWNEERQSVTLTWSLFGGHSAALFAMLAGVGLAFASGGRTPWKGRRMRGARFALVGRAAVVALVGLALGHLELPVANILAYYGMLFLLAIPFLGLRIRYLLLSAVIFALTAPFLMQWGLDALPPDRYGNPSLWGIVFRPGTVISQLLLTGTYPALPWMTFLLTGLAVGRMRLTDTAVQARLVIGGVALALSAYGSSMAALLWFGGYNRIAEATFWMTERQIDDVITFGPDPQLPTTTLWWLLVPGPHTNTPFALAISLGAALAALGAVLLLSRGAAVAKWLSPLAAMGSMTFTLYTAHLLFMGLGIHYDARTLWLWVQILAFALFAVVWHRAVGRGPLEKIVSLVSTGIARRVAARAPGGPAGADGT